MKLDLMFVDMVERDNGNNLYIWHLERSDTGRIRFQIKLVGADGRLVAKMQEAYDPDSKYNSLSGNTEETAKGWLNFMMEKLAYDTRMCIHTREQWFPNTDKAQQLADRLEAFEQAQEEKGN